MIKRVYCPPSYGAQSSQWLDQLIAEPLMTSILVIMIEVLTYGIASSVFAEQDRLAQAFRLE